MRDQRAEIELEFKIGQCNGTMHLQVFDNDQLIGDYGNFNSDHFVLKTTIGWPSTMKLVLTNKDLSQDTKVDENGKITADKFIHLQKITVDKVEPDISFLQSLVLVTSDQEINTCYWGFNGYVDLMFDQCDSFAWHLNQKVKDEKTYTIVTHKKW